MLIANPIYDVVFKRMMENERVAKFFISTLLDTNIESIEVKPQEFTYTEELIGVAVFRLDFIATIKTEIGEYKKILIEIQKAKNLIDLMRFRRYLGEQYKKDELLNGVKAILPITTIYILGFKLPEIDVPCIKIERNYKDLVNNKILKTKSEFVEKLTHDSFIVQVERITERYQTKLDKLLSLFEQRNFLDDDELTKDYRYEIDIDEIKLSTDILHHSGTDPESRKKLEIEQEAWRTINALVGDKDSELLKTKKLIEEQNKVLEEKGKELEEKGKELEEKGKELEEKGKELEEKGKEIEVKDKEIEVKDKEIEDKDREIEIQRKTIEELMKKLNQQN
jgi:hypothetical protein